MPVSPRYKSVAAYNHGAMLLHWLIAFLLIAQLCGGYLMEHYAALPDPVRFTFYQLHKTFGVIILLLALMRLAWRLLYRPPAELPIGKAEKAATQIVTFLFYALMVAVPLLGWIVVSYSPRTIPTLLFGSPYLVWPPLPPRFEFITHAQAVQAHIVLAYSFIFLLFLHICGALKHQFYDHMPMIARMVPSRRLQAQHAGKSAFLLLLLAVFCLGAVIIYFGFLGAQQAGTAATAAQATTADKAQPAAAQAAAAGFDNANWVVDYGQSSVTYAMEFSGAMKNGAVSAWQADIRFDPDRLNKAKAVIILDSGSVSYEDTYIKADIGAKDGLAAAQYPHMRVALDQFSRQSGGPDMFQAKGLVTIRNITRPILLNFRFSDKKGRAIVDGQADLNRLAFNLGKENDPEAEWLGEIIHIKIHLVAYKKPAKTA